MTAEAPTPEQPAAAKPPRGRKVEQAELDKWIEMRKAGSSVAKIAKEHGRQQAFVYQKLKKVGVIVPKARKPKEEVPAPAAAPEAPDTPVASRPKQVKEPLNPAAAAPKNLAELLRPQSTKGE